MIGLTVLTPTYNRGELLQKIYQSMLEQSNQNFQWLIIDDGSSDNTEEIVESLKVNHRSNFIITYEKKANGGKHTALNFAHPYILGEYVMVLDSDDYLISQGIQKIYDIMSKSHEFERIGWFAMLKGNADNTSKDQPYKENFGLTNYIQYMNEGRKGECCDVYHTEVFRTYPYPEVSGEKFVSESYLNIQASKYGHYNMVTVNQVIQVVEYLDEGLTELGRKLQLRSPLGNAELWKHVSGSRFSKRIQIKAMLLYTVYSLFGKRNIFEIINYSQNKRLTILTYPMSLLLYFYWLFKYR